jgi:pimeloyl-ACP methyl ester carboxylesterase
VPPQGILAGPMHDQAGQDGGGVAHIGEAVFLRGEQMTSLAEWRKAGSFFEHKGHRIFWRESGNSTAPALLLIHGFPTASWDWGKLWSDLADRYHVLTLDMIGFGFSDKPYAYDYRIMDQADVCDEFLQMKAVREYDVLAHDYGVSVAAELMARDSENAARPRLLSVALLNGGLFPEMHRRIFLQSLLLSPLGPLVSLLTSEERLSKNMRILFGKHYAPEQEILDGMWTLIKTNHGERIMHKLIHYIPDRIKHRERWVGALQETNVPVKLIDGMLDPVSGAHMVVHFRKLIPNANVTELPQAGHYPQVQVPREVLQAYLEFRGQVGKHVSTGLQG